MWKLSLRWKLGIAFLSVVLISVGITSYLVNRSAQREFKQYISYGSSEYLVKVSDILGEVYQINDGWTGLQNILGGWYGPPNTYLIVADNSGAIVGDTSGQWIGREISDLRIQNPTEIIVGNDTVGSVYLITSAIFSITPPTWRGQNLARLTQIAEQEFLRRFNRSLLLGSMLAIAVAILIGILLTRHITQPLRLLTQGVGRIARGDFKHRVDVTTDDELGKLATSFNTMAANLDTNEQNRRRLMADIAHELRTPLSVIEGMVDGMLDGVFEPNRDNLISIKAETALLTRLVADLRDISLAESGKLSLEQAPVNLVELVKLKVSQSAISAGDKGVHLQVNTPDEVPSIMADPTRIEQVIANLLSNAIRHTPDGGSVTVKIQSTDDVDCNNTKKEGLLVSVSDTGEGISKDNLPYIFERFYRIDESRSRRMGGVGLGLAIVKYIVEAHGGKVWVESTVGKGSEFYFTLPFSGIPQTGFA